MIPSKNKNQPNKTADHILADTYYILCMGKDPSNIIEYRRMKERNQWYLLMDAYNKLTKPKEETKKSNKK